MSFFFLFPPSIFAGWQRVAQFNTTVNASFFFNEQRGFVAMDGQDGILRTSDGGKTWFNCVIPPGFGGFITDMFMTDSLHGWVTIEETGNGFAYGLWATNDGGVSWHVSQGIQGNFTSVYQTPSAVIVGDRFTINSLSASTNGGLNFARTSSDLFNGINFTDDLHGVASVYLGTALWTADGGASWQPTSNITVEGWGVYAQKGSPNFIISGEKNAKDPRAWQCVYASNDYGVTWQILDTLFGRTTGHIAGVGSVLYVQALTPWIYGANRLKGMMRSTDGGNTWKSVGGPANYRDTRFTVTGCLGGVVYAFDETGGVWKTTDGGNGEIHEPPHNPNLTPNKIDLASTMCATASAKLTYNNLSCNQLIIDKIQFIDSSDPVVSTGALSFTRYPALPQTLDPTMQDYLMLNWDPVKYGVQKSLSTTYVRVHSTMLNGTLEFDTLFAVNTSSFANQPLFSLSATNFKFDSLNICQREVDTTVTFTNESCDTLWLDSTLFNSPSDWELLDPLTFNPLMLPIGLANGESASFIIKFAPIQTGAQTASLKLHFTHQGLSRDTVLSFSAFCYRIMKVKVNDSLTFPPASVCMTRDSVIQFNNPNCDTMTIDGVKNISQYFTDVSGVTFPVHLAPGETLNYRIRYTGVKNQKSTANLIFQYNIDRDTNISETTLQGTALPGSSLFATSPGISNITFSDRLSCSPRDSIVFTVLNPGCDTLSVINSSLKGLNVPAITYRTDPPLPIILSNAGDSVRITIYLQADTATTNNGVLDFTYKLSDGSVHDSLFTVHAVVSQRSHVASISEQSIDLGSGALCDEKDTVIIITNPGCPNLTVNNISLSGNYFYMSNQRVTPFVLAQGESDTIHVGYSPTSSGNDVGQVQITTDADVNPIEIIPLSASTNPIDHISFRLEQENSGLLPGDTAYIAFIPDRDWSGKGLHNLDFSVITNGNLLTYNGYTWQADQSFQSIVTTASLPGNQSILNVQLSSPKEIILQKDKPLVEFHYGTTLTDTIATPVTLSLLSLNKADPNYLNCILSPATQDGDFILGLECGSKTLIDFLHGKMPILSGDIHPNPVTSQTNYQASLPFTSHIAGIAEVNYYDALGKIVQSESISLDQPGNYTAHFDGSKISGGVYDYLIRLKDSPSNTARGHIILLK